MSSSSRVTVRGARTGLLILGTVALLAASLAALLAGPPAAGAMTTPGAQVTARLTQSASGQLSLRIRQGERTVFNGPVRSRVCGTTCSVAAVPPGRAAIHALELGGAQPAVLLGLFSGGAHCCFSDQLYVVDSARDTVRRSEIDLLDDQPTLVKLGKSYALRGADARLAEEYFTDFAHSGAPFAEWALTSRGFVSITRRFRGDLATDASRWWRRSRREVDNDVGDISAWAADEDLLGQSRLVAETLATLVRQHRLNSSLAGPGHSGASFVSALQRALRRLGYTRG